MQMGTFDIDTNTQVVNKVHAAGFMFKEHNADYLTKVDIVKRRVIGIDALNIAPQLGTVQTKILKELASDNKEWYEFAKRVYDSGFWTKWIPRDVVNKDLAVTVAGHYLFHTIEYRRLLQTIDTMKMNAMLTSEMNGIFDLYGKD
jgi:hypothetical protein